MSFENFLLGFTSPPYVRIVDIYFRSFFFKMRVYLRKQNGAKVTLEVEPNDSVDNFQSKIAASEGIPARRQTLVFDGRLVRAGQQLSDYNVQAESTFGLGMNGFVGQSQFYKTLESENDLPTKFLMLQRLQRMEFIQQHRRELVSQLAELNVLGDGRLELWQFDITKLQLRAVNDFADMLVNFLQETCAPHEDIPGVLEGAFDFIVRIQPEQLQRVLQSVDKFAEQASEYRQDVHSPPLLVQRLLRTHPIGSRAALALRLTGNSAGGCAKFYRDIGYGLKTVQMMLTDYNSYAGGDFVYFKNNRLHTPKRMAGTITRHGQRLLHGVSRLYAGTKKSLFVVNCTHSSRFNDVSQVPDDQVRDLCQRIKQRFALRSSSHVLGTTKKAQDKQQREAQRQARQAPQAQRAWRAAAPTKRSNAATDSAPHKKKR